MYSIVKCSEVSDKVIQEGFKAGFVDYIIQIEMDVKTFANHFFGVEGNEREYSFIAFKNNEPVGVILSGLRTDEPFKTLRCGAMSIKPEERGNGLAQDLMVKHEEVAKMLGCKQLFLEVIVGNDRAIAFYKKSGYEKVYDLTYRKLLVEEKGIKFKRDESVYKQVVETDIEEIRKLRSLDLSHMPWQGSFPYIQDMKCHCYGIKEENELKAGLIMTPEKVYYLWVHPTMRLQGYGSALLLRGINDLEPKSLRMTYTNNSLVHTFANYIGMELDPISQFEMYKWLD